MEKTIVDLIELGIRIANDDSKTLFLGWNDLETAYNLKQFNTTQ